MHLNRARVAACGAVAKQDDAKAKGPGAGKTDKQKANAVSGESSSATEFERWSGLNLGTPGARR